MSELDLSITIITYNEERDLPRCLASLPRGAEVIVVDSGSTDRTVEIAKAHGAKVSSSAFINYGEQKNKALQQATRNWVFSSDADEEMDAVLRLWLQENFASPKFAHHINSFVVRRQLIFMGRKIRFGKGRDFSLRLFRRDSAYFNGALHERLVGKSPLSATKLKQGMLHHHSYADHHDYYIKFNHFTDIFAQQCYQKRSKVPRLHVLRPLRSFLHLYVLRGGFLDGYPGYCLALYASLYSFVKYAKLIDLYRREALPPAGKPVQR